MFFIRLMIMEISCDNRTKNHHESTTTTQKRIQRKRKNCRRYFRHEALEMIKLGVNNKPVRKLTDLDTFMKPTIPIVDNLTQNTTKNTNDDDKRSDDDDDDDKLPPICAKVPVICSTQSLQKFNIDQQYDKSDKIKIHSVIKINPSIKQNHQNKQLSTGFMIRDLLEIETNQQKPPPAHLQPNQAPHLQFPLIRTKPPNLLPPQYPPPPPPLYAFRNNLPNYPQQYNQKLPPPTSSTINTTVTSHGSCCSRNDRLPGLYERFKEPILGENSRQQQRSKTDDLVKYPIYNPDYRLKRLDKRIPYGKLCYIKEKHALLRYYDDNEKRLYLSNVGNHNNNNNDNDKNDDKRVLIRLPKQINFNIKEQLTVEEYVIEMEYVRRFVPLCFYQFYKYVTGYQIVNQQLPVSFLTFLNVHNTNGLLDLKRRYIRNLKD